MSYLRLFGFTVLITTGLLLTISFFGRDKAPRPKLVNLAARVYLSSQLQPESLSRLRDRIRTVVDFRPDGEAQDQPSSQMMSTEAKKLGMNFYYIPVPHGSIPDHAVDELAHVLAAATDEGPMVLYCRTGRRAVKTFALAQATLPQGPTADEICNMVAGAGFSAEDLRSAIQERIAKRPESAHP